MPIESISYFLKRVSQPDTDLYNYGYRFVRELGKGSYGAVGAFKDINDGRLYAIKVMAADRRSHDIPIENFNLDVKKEHQNLAQINRLAPEKCGEISKYLMKYASLPSTDPRYYYLVSEVMTNDLSHLFDNQFKIKNTVTDDVVMAIICQLFHGLRCLNQIGIIHGDLKLGNIFIAPNGQIKIGDFGGSASVENYREVFGDEVSRDEVSRDEVSGPSLREQSLRSRGNNSVVGTQSRPSLREQSLRSRDQEAVDREAVDREDSSRAISIREDSQYSIDIQEVIDRHKMVTSFTSNYTAPEVQKESRFDMTKFQPKSDVWSLGIIILALTTNNPRIINQNLGRFPQAQIDGIINSYVDRLNNDTNTKIKKLLSKMLQVNPRNRMNIEQLITYNTFKELCDIPVAISRRRERIRDMEQEQENKNKAREYVRINDFIRDEFTVID